MKTKNPKLGGFYAYREELKPRETYTRKGVETKNSGVLIDCKLCRQKVSAVGSRCGTCRPCHEERWRKRKGLPSAKDGGHGSFIKQLTGIAKSKDRWCRGCETLKPLENFEVLTSFGMRGVYLAKCRDCDNSFTKVPLSALQRKRILDFFEHTCQICGVKGSARMAVDHCHKTNVLRGVLCFHCNTAIGHLKEDAKIILRAAEYLNKSRK